MALADASLDDTAGQQVSIAFNPAKAERLFAGSGHTFAELLRVADEGKALPHFALPRSVRAKVKVEVQDDRIAQRGGNGQGQRSRARQRMPSSPRRTSITSASVRRSMTRSTTARWTTHQASPR